MSIQKIPKSYSLPVASVLEVKDLAKKKGVSNSEIVAQALDFYLGHRSIEGTVRAEMAKVDSSVNAILKSLLVFAVALDEASPMKPFIASKIGEQATEDLIRKIENERARAGQ